MKIGLDFKTSNMAPPVGVVASKCKVVIMTHHRGEPAPQNSHQVSEGEVRELKVKTSLNVCI